MINDLPENYHRFFGLWYKEYDFDKEANQFRDIVDQARIESDIQRYIKSNNKWFIPAALFRNYDFGHHDAYVSVEHQLGESFRADYMLLGKNSLGYHIVLVEFENANVDYRLKNSCGESESVRKGLVQIRDWKCWMDENRSYFLGRPGTRDICNNIPSWGINYCLVVSRRDKMDEKANKMRRITSGEIRGLKIVTYDRLIDNVRQLSNGF